MPWSRAVPLPIADRESTSSSASTSSVFPTATSRSIGAASLASQWVERIDAALHAERSARTVVIVLSLWLTVFANWPLWMELAQMGGGAPSLYLPKVATMAVLVFAGAVALFSFTAWSRWMKPLWLGIVLLAAVVQHYMLSYHMVMDPTMLANVFQTDPHEARDLVGWRLAFNVLWVVVLPALWLWRLRVTPMRAWSNAWRNGLLLVGVFGMAAAVALLAQRELAPLMRNNVSLRYMMNPVASVYSAGAVVLKPLFKRSGRLVPITAGTSLGASYAAQSKPPMFVLVVGETARADHFALNGYSRDTTPELEARNVLSWHDVHSCGTNTLASVPCMFSHLGKKAFEARKNEYENLTDVLQASGLAVFWLDNQAGCKGVCERVPHASASDGLDPSMLAALCDGDECLDEVMLKGLDARIAALPADRRARGVVLVMHQMGSHGPAYYKRSPQDGKRFVPECKTNALAECSHAELINAYDNSIATTDRFLAHTIDWLKGKSAQYDTGMLYLSDHGESLGEYGLFLHGLPYAFAPEMQKHVPMVAWFSDGMLARDKLSTACLGKGLDTELTHDNLYHTVLGLMDVQTPTYGLALDAFASCRGREADAVLKRPVVGPRVTGTS